MIDPVYKRLLAENAWLRQQITLLQEEHKSVNKDTPEDIARHNEIVDKVATHHGTMHPHMTTHISGGGAPDTEKSIAHIKDTLGARRPLFKSVDDALGLMKDDAGFAPYHLRAPNGVDIDDSAYGEMLAGVKKVVDDRIDNHEEKMHKGKK